MAITLDGTTGITTPAETITTNLTFTGTGNRITGDFSNATQANRIAFQSSTTNGTTSVNAIPNGTATTSQFIAFAGTDMNNTSRAGLNTSSTVAIFFADKTGTGTYLPLTFYTGGSESARIDTSGNVLIGTTSQIQGGKLSVYGNIGWGAGTTGRIYSDANWQMLFQGNSGTSPYGFLDSGGTNCLMIDASRNVLVMSPAGLGYGTGSGGTVTQATSKATGVTLNKPTGQITMNNAALLPATSVVFVLSNSLLAASDSVIVQPNYGTNSQSYTAQVTFAGSGGVHIRVTNTTAGSLSEAVTLSFAIIKGATS